MINSAPAFSGWRVLAALWAVAFVTQAFPNFGAGVINAAMAQELGLERSTLGLGFSLFVLTQGSTAPLVALLVNRWGARLVIFAGALAIGLCALALALLASQAWHYLLLFGVLMGTACAIGGGIPLQSCTSLWFVRRRGLAMSVVMTASSLGGFVAAPLLGRLVSHGGDWRMGWYCVAAVMVLAAIVALLGVRDSPARCGQVADGDAGQPAVSASARRMPPPVYRNAQNMHWRNTLQQPAMWISVNAALAFNVVAFTLLSHLVPHLQGLDYTPQVAALALGCMSLVGVLGKLAAGLLCDRMESRWVWSSALMCCAIGLFLMLDARTVAVVCLAAALVGLGAGAAFVCWANLVANYFGAGSFAAVMGLQMALQTPIAALAPYLVGLVYDRAGSYAPAFVFICAYAAVSALVLLLARPPRVTSFEVVEQWVH